MRVTVVVTPEGPGDDAPALANKLAEDLVQLVPQGAWLEAKYRAPTGGLRTVSSGFIYIKKD